ncbi:MAG TPA: hypothetical protein VGR50_06260 [Terriglobales bacterium]|nr:hypothetical protein [Terriglobales bacterium]
MQIALALFLIAFAIRTLLIFRQRNISPIKQQQTGSAPMDADSYVVSHKIYAYDLKSAREALVGKPVWVKAGYGVAFYPYNASTKKADFFHQAGLLGPIEQLEIKDIVMNRTPGSPGQWQGPPGARFRIHTDDQQVMAVFAKDGKTYAFSIGLNSNGDYHFIADDLLFTQDPHQLYKHWPAATWQAIEQHQVLKTMNEVQVAFAIGVPDSSTSGSLNDDENTVHYANNGHPMNVTFVDGKATQIKPASADAHSQ